MFEIRQNRRMVHGKSVPTYARDITTACTMEIEAGTNGLRGGDTGHGSRTYICIKNTGGTDIHATALGKDEDEGIEICLGGDSELISIIQALKFAAKVLEDQMAEVYD